MNASLSPGSQEWSSRNVTPNSGWACDEGRARERRGALRMPTPADGQRGIWSLRNWGRGQPGSKQVSLSTWRRQSPGLCLAPGAEAASPASRGAVGGRVQPQGYPPLWRLPLLPLTFTGEAIPSKPLVAGAAIGARGVVAVGSRAAPVLSEDTLIQVCRGQSLESPSVRTGGCREADPPTQPCTQPHHLHLAPTYLFCRGPCPGTHRGIRSHPPPSLAGTYSGNSQGR